MRASRLSSASSSDEHEKPDKSELQGSPSETRSGTATTTRRPNARQSHHAELPRQESLTPTAVPRRPVPDATAEHAIESGAGTTEDSSPANGEEEYGNDGVGGQRGGLVDRSRATSEELRLERLREAVLLSQQRARLDAGKKAQSPSSLANRRVSPIKEEPSNPLSPTLDEAFASPMTAGMQTASTESTESARTVKGSVPPTPGAGALRTPSYPFPYVPGTPSTWSSSFHRPFTTLSPTVSAHDIKDVLTPRDRPMSSGQSTPAASAATFMPGATREPDQASQPEQYPSPSLYDLVLALNCEPGLDAWWAVVVNVIRDWYGAERATLAIPADASELETVPWGQKATYNTFGRLDLLDERKDDNKPSYPRDLPLRKAQDEREQPPAKPTSTPRPRLAARHSYAGFEQDRNSPTTPLDAPSSARPQRPAGLSRTVSHAPQSSTRLDRTSRDLAGSHDHRPPAHPLRQLVSIASASDPDFSSIAPTHHSGPYEAVFPTLRALDIEANSLLDSAGVIKVLEKGRLVTLTRDYAVSTSSRGPSAEPATDSENETTTKGGKAKAEPRKPATRPTKPERMQSDYFSRARLPTTYEEYEQFPVSPWAQSPAPSPAIQGDPDENPFFTSPKMDEDSFNPTEDAVPNYSRYTQVPAIGVDKASTITHIPLIHPVLSQLLPPLPQRTSSVDPSQLRRTSTAERLESSSDTGTPREERRAPIAVISFLSQTVPYPQNLTQSLKLLAPHLATTFANANQYSNALKQVANIRHRRLLSNSQKVDFAPLPDQPESLENLLQLDIDDINASVSGSMTSPSDYSAQSRFSPGGSLQGTPGWDTGIIGFSRSTTTTPAHIPGLEGAENYFEAKKRSSSSSKESGSTPHKVQRHLQAGDSKSRSSQASTATFESDASMPRHVSTEKAQAEYAGRRSNSPSNQHEVVSPRKSSLRGGRTQAGDRIQHTQLHSFGADFQSSFSTLQATTTPSAARSAEEVGHARSNSVEMQDMLPPSEKLLRIIVDALPVQVFMAEPSNGSITWANAKYLAYRGQESRQIVQDPWHTIHSDDAIEYLHLWRRCLRNGMQLSHKVRLQRFDGQYRWFFVKIAPLKDKRQNIVHWVGTNMDFHEQHIAETNAARQQETAASEAKYRAVANSSPQIVFAATRKEGVTFCNSQWTNYSGQSEGEARGMGFMNCVHPEDLEKCKLPSFKPDGTPMEVPVSMHSHISSKSAETVKESSSSEDSFDSPTITSPSTDETAHQSEVHQLPQAKLSKLATTGILKVVRDAEGRPSYSTEVRLRNRDGRYRWHLVRVLRSELKDSDDEDQTWYGTCTDINDHKLLEQTLKETMDAKSRFLSNMSHEIRTPLNGITGMVNFLIDSNLTAEQMEHVNIIRNSTEGLRDLINDILDLSKVEAGMITLTKDWMHVRSLIEEVNDLTSALAIDKGLELNYIVTEDVPPMVKGDRFRIRQVLLNVIGNAIKFTQRGEVFVRCQRLVMDTSQLAIDEALVQFEVIDTGSGFTEKEAEFLFKRFSQIDGSSTRQHGGTGLGLAISMQLVELHGGTMRASSVPGKGSTFTFSIRFRLPSDQDRPPPPPATPGIIALPTPGLTTPLEFPSPKPSPTIVPPQSLARQLAARSAEGSDASSRISSPGTDRHSSVSSGGSAPSISLTQSSTRSDRSSQSSFVPDTSQILPSAPLTLRLPGKERSESGLSSRTVSDSSTESNKSDQTVRPIIADAASAASITPVGITATPVPLLSILVVCPLRWSREATVKHIEMTLPKSTPYNVTSREKIEDGLTLLRGDEAVVFTHVVVSVKEADKVVPFMDLFFNATVIAGNVRKNPSNTILIIVCDLSQKREIMQRAPRFDYEGLQRDRRLRFVFKPLKPSKLAVIFDPQRERDVSSDRALEGAQAIAVSQKQVFDEMKRRLGNKDNKVLLVEDNKTNQMVLLKFLKRAEIAAEAVLDGVQCTDRVFSQPYGTYSIILCDLHMPNKDGYQTCKEIRKWERRNRYPHLPIIALSANVLGDVYAKCVEAGFNNYVTKPVDFKELSDVMTTFLDRPEEEKGKPIKFMRTRDER